MTINNTTYVMVEDGGNMSLTAASNAKASASGQRGSRGGNMPGGMPQMNGRPDMESMTREKGGNASGEAVDIRAFEMPEGLQVSWYSQALARLMAWLYEGVDMGASQVTGSLVQVEVGMQNDDYVEILNGVSEGQVVLYTGEEETSSSWSRGGNMPGGMRMGF